MKTETVDIDTHLNDLKIQWCDLVREAAAHKQQFEILTQNANQIEQQISRLEQEKQNAV